MSRLPALHRDDLDETGQALWDQIVSTRSAAVVDEQGGLRGPFNPWVHVPEVGRRAADLGAHLRFGVSVERRLPELAIITVGAHWKAEFEWWAHVPMAREHGVSEPVIEAIGRGADTHLRARRRTDRPRGRIAAVRRRTCRREVPTPTRRRCSEIEASSSS